MEADDPGIRFTSKSRAALDRFGLTLQDSIALISAPDIVTPDDKQTPGREVRYVGGHGFICAIDTTETGDRTVFVIGVFERNHGDGQAPESLREVPRSQPRYTGAGNATGTMPTSFEEVLDRVEATPGWHVEEGRGKRPLSIVSDGGQHRHPVPSSASDHRALRNFVSQLRAHGLDVRRPAGGSKR